MLDDYREAYYWMRKNTDEHAKFLSWWDYGYQMAGMGNRTVIVDNNTWNNTHIATVGRVGMGENSLTIHSSPISSLGIGQQRG